MRKFSTYKYLKLKDITSAPHFNFRSWTIKHPRKLKKIFIFLIVAVLSIKYFLGLFTFESQLLDRLARSLGYESVYHHAVIIDAGSSGSTVFAYKFRVPFRVYGPVNLDLVDEYFEQSKPGLSSYADDPEKGADTIVQLIKNAESLTPPNKRNSTPLIVRATADLRLLPADKGQQLIDHVSRAINKLGYYVAPDGVQIMKSSDEGVFLWYTLNLLHKGFTMAALDLGDNSTQITHELRGGETSAYPAGDQYVVPDRYNITLYTHSYQNLGLYTTRYGVFRRESGNNSSQELTSVCVHPIIQREPWTYANNKYFVSGTARARGFNSETVYATCHAAVRRYVLAMLDWEPLDPPHASVTAIGYFYDVAADAGIIDVMVGETVLLEEYYSAAMLACDSGNVDQPWACIDLVYIVTLLQDAYKMNINTPISLFKKLNGHEVSWALGLAYTTVMNRIAITP